MLFQSKTVERRHRRASRLVERAFDGGQRVSEPVVGRLLAPLRGQALLDPFDRIEHHAGIGIAVALGVFAKKPAAPRGLHEGFADRLIILLARLRGAR